MHLTVQIILTISKMPLLIMNKNEFEFINC